MEVSRFDFYFKLHEFTGNLACLDMLEISSSSGIRGGVAWNINEAMTSFVGSYPDEGVERFSEDIASALLRNIKDNLIAETNTYTVPSDYETYTIAFLTWEEVGLQYKDKSGLSHYFPGNIQLALHYLLNGDLGGFNTHIGFVAENFGSEMFLSLFYEVVGEVVADEANYSKSVDDILATYPADNLEAITTGPGVRLVIARGDDGQIEHVLRGSSPEDTCEASFLALFSLNLDILNAGFKAFDSSFAGEMIGNYILAHILMLSVNENYGFENAYTFTGLRDFTSIDLIEVNSFIDKALPQS